VTRAGSIFFQFFQSAFDFGIRERFIAFAVKFRRISSQSSLSGPSPIYPARQTAGALRSKKPEADVHVEVFLDLPDLPTKRNYNISILSVISGGTEGLFAAANDAAREGGLFSDRQHATSARAVKAERQLERRIR
jgi:hypothetical protein